MATSTPAELAAAIGWGAVGATCNQVIALATIRAYLPRWQARIVELAAERPTATESEIGWAVVTPRSGSVDPTVEVGDWSRFSGSTIGAYLGLVPTESSSGEGRHQGSITKTGNTPARRLLVEAAWHHQRPYRPTTTMRDR